MHPFQALIRFAALVMLLFAANSARAAEPDGLQLTPLVASVLAPPHAFPGSDGRVHLVYEVRIANGTGTRLRLERIGVADAKGGAPLATLDAAAIGGRLSLGGRRGSEARELRPFQFGVVFLHVTLAAGAPVPARLVHTIEGSLDEPRADITVRVAETSVVSSPVPSLGPPLRGHGYVAADGCCNSIRHVRALLALNGTFYLSQRFAVDWERIDAEGTIFRGNPKDVRSYHIYGDAVLAVTDATVIASRNDLPDQVPGKLPDGLPLDEADGNYVILDVGGGAYALYAHMVPGSVRVRAGDHVRRGDQLGTVGNTGNSQAPHLHFQMMDGPSGFASNGVPYVFDAFAVTAVDQAGTADFDRAEATGSPLTLTPRVPPASFSQVMPLDLSVVDWRN